MCREDSGEILSDDLTDKSDCPGQSSNESSQQDTNTTLLLEEESEMVLEQLEQFERQEQGQGGNWSAVDVYKIFHQFNTTTAPERETAVVWHSSSNNISADSELNRTLAAIKRTNTSTNITGDSKEPDGEREKRSAGYYHQPLHISREDDIPVLSVAGTDPGLQYHSM